MQTIEEMTAAVDDFVIKRDAARKAIRKGLDSPEYRAAQDLEDVAFRVMEVLAHKLVADKTADVTIAAFVYVWDLFMRTATKHPDNDAVCRLSTLAQLAMIERHASARLLRTVA